MRSSRVDTRRESRWACDAVTETKAAWALVDAGDTCNANKEPSPCRADPEASNHRLVANARRVGGTTLF